MILIKSKKKNTPDEISTKEKILLSAVNLFAVKGFTETTIRELADAAGLKGGSIYNHFPSKNAILEYILKDYSTFSSSFFDEDVVRAKLKANPTIDGIMDCLVFYFPQGKTDYHLKVLSVLLQEQYRNPLIHDFISHQILLQGEKNINTVYEILKELNVIRKDADLDPWVKINSSLLYAFCSRIRLGIGETSPEYSGMGLVELMRYAISQMLGIYGVENRKV